MFGIGVQELLIVLAIALIVFGGKSPSLDWHKYWKVINNFKKGIAGQGIDETPLTKEIEELKNAK